MKVCVIGAGQSGLVTCKTFVEAGYNVIVLEQSGTNGLYHNIKEKDYFRWSSSRYISGFSDFPIPKDYPVWMSMRQYIQYINKYKVHFGLDRYIYYHSKVIRCEPKQNGWLVHYEQKEINLSNLSITRDIPGKKHSIWVDKLIVTTGLNSVPKYPTGIGLENFSGKILHSDDFYLKMNKNQWRQTLANKKVLLLGGGESAFDIGHLCLEYTEQLWFASKNYIEWFPDYGYSEEKIRGNMDCFKMNPVFFGLKPEDGWASLEPSDTFLSWLEYSLPTPVSGLWHQHGRKMVFTAFGRDVRKNNCVHNHDALCKTSKTPNSLFKKFVVKRTPFMCDMYLNKVKIIHYPNFIKGSTAYTLEDDIQNIDIIICASGYQMKFDFLDPSFYSYNLSNPEKKDPLIKKMVPRHQQNLAFVGFVRPTMGSINNVAEMQSWWLSLFFKKKLNYKIRDFAWARPQDPLNVKNDFVNTIVIGNYYYKDLAMDMNICPNMPKLFFTKPKVWWHIIHSTIHPMVFRLQGCFNHKNAEQIYLETLPSDKRLIYSMKYYYLFFFLLHVIFIMCIVLISYLIVYCLRKSGILQTHTHTYSLVLSFLFIWYTYKYWY